jgi:hypothetical protein
MRRLFVLLIPLTLVLATGCSIQGKWTLEKIEPTAGLHEFDYASLTLQKDGSFYGEALNPGVRATAGTYVYKNDTLVLEPYDGPRVAYAAKFRDANHLKLEQTTENERIEALFQRAE